MSEGQNETRTFQKSLVKLESALNPFRCSKTEIIKRVNKLKSIKDRENAKKTDSFYGLQFPGEVGDKSTFDK